MVQILLSLSFIFFWDLRKDSPWEWGWVTGYHENPSFLFLFCPSHLSGSRLQRQHTNCLQECISMIASANEMQPLIFNLNLKSCWYWSIFDSRLFSFSWGSVLNYCASINRQLIFNTSQRCSSRVVSYRPRLYFFRWGLLPSFGTHSHTVLAAFVHTLHFQTNKQTNKQASKQ